MGPTETATEYGLRTQQLLNKVRAALSAEFESEEDAGRVDSYMSFVTKAALDSFQRGLRPELEFRVALRNPATLDAAIEIAHAESRTLIDRSQLLPPASQYSSFPRPFSNVPSRSYASPIVPRVPYANNPRSYPANGERFAPRAPGNQHNRAQQPDHSRSFMTPRKPSFVQGAYQPPTPRYADREVAAYPTQAEYLDTSEYYDPRASFPDSYEEEYYSTPTHPQNQYQPHGEVWYEQPPSHFPLQYSQFPIYHKQVYSKEGETIRSYNGLEQQEIPSTPIGRQPALPLIESAGDLNASGARLTNTQASATSESRKTVPTYTIMKASTLQKQLPKTGSIQK